MQTWQKITIINKYKTIKEIHKKHTHQNAHDKCKMEITNKTNTTMKQKTKMKHKQTTQRK